MTNLLTHLRERLQLRQDYAETFRTPHGRRVLADIMKRAGVTQPIFDANPEKSRFLEGHRHLALSIFRSAVKSSDADLLKLIEEEMNNPTQHDTHY